MPTMINRRDMMKGTAALVGGFALPATLESGIAAAAQGSQGGSGRAVGKDDLALVNGKFVDGRGEMTTALTIKNGRITSIGSGKPPDADVMRVDLQGRTVIPGLFDSHVHYARAGVNPGTRRAVSSGPSRSRNFRRPSPAGRRPFRPAR